MFWVFSFPLVWPLRLLGAKKLKSANQAIVFVALSSKVPTRPCFLFTLSVGFTNKSDKEKKTKRLRRSYPEQTSIQKQKDEDAVTRVNYSYKSKLL